MSDHSEVEPNNRLSSRKVCHCRSKGTICDCCLFMCLQRPGVFQSLNYSADFYTPKTNRLLEVTHLSSVSSFFVNMLSWLELTHYRLPILPLLSAWTRSDIWSRFFSKYVFHGSQIRHNKPRSTVVLLFLSVSSPSNSSASYSIVPSSTSCHMTPVSQGVNKTFRCSVKASGCSSGCSYAR